MGATDYLPKPFDPTLLEARIKSSLAARRLRELESHVLEQVGIVVDAASALEAGTFDPSSLESVGARDDALGALARGFQEMAAEVQAREERLRREIAELRAEAEHARETTP
jgi:DNA-binding response OmpR family regulator